MKKKMSKVRENKRKSCENRISGLWGLCSKIKGSKVSIFTERSKIKIVAIFKKRRE